METIVSAVVGDIVSRIISSVIARYNKSQSIEVELQRLQQLLLRVCTIVEEAQDRDITNEVMLLQLKMLMEAMYRGYFVQDSFKYRALTGKAAGDDVVTHSLALSGIMCPRKRQCLATSMVFGSETVNELMLVLENLGSVIANVHEFLILLGNYPRMFRRPYSSYLFAGTCMFGRQIERQRIINFLLEKDQNSGTRELSVLPIIGQRGVGKRTLVEHVCKDERVLHYYSSILHITGNDLRKEMLRNERFFLPTGRCLLVIEFGSSEIDEAAWGGFYSSWCSKTSAGSKIIITSRVDKIISFGTTQPLILAYLPTEEFWYFFKMLAFGSSDANEHPRLAFLAMQIAAELKGSFLLANLYGPILRLNSNAQFWLDVLECWRKSMQRNLLLFEGTQTDLVAKDHPYYYHQMGRDYSKVYFFYNYYSTNSLSIELPKVTAQDLVTGSNIPIEEEFQVLGHKSLIPPYHNYIASCIVKQKPQMVMSKKKRDRRKSTHNS